MIFGLKNALSTLQRMMDQICADFPLVLVYLDYVVVLSTSLEESISHLQELCEKLLKNHIKVEITIWNFSQPEIKLLGHVLDKNGVTVDPEKVEEILKTHSPTTSSELRGLPGI